MSGHTVSMSCQTYCLTLPFAILVQNDTNQMHQVSVDRPLAKPKRKRAAAIRQQRAAQRGQWLMRRGGVWGSKQSFSCRAAPQRGPDVLTGVGGCLETSFENGGPS